MNSARNLSIRQQLDRQLFWHALRATLLKIVLFVTLNNLLFLLLINHPISETRPWTLFLSEYWDRTPDKLYLLWQLFVILNTLQVLWLLYQGMKPQWLNGYYQLTHRLENSRKTSRLTRVVLKLAEYCYLLVSAPIRYRQALYEFAQLALLTVVALLIWTTLYLAVFHTIDHFTLSVKEMLANTYQLSQQTKQQHAFHIALAAAASTIVGMVLLGKSLPRLIRSLSHTS